jgi:methylated-DNA-[protein]-cysteine S-methyltransferase
MSLPLPESPRYLHRISPMPSAPGGSTSIALYSAVETPLGKLLIVGDAEGLRHIVLANRAESLRVDWHFAPSAFPEAIHQLQAYFAGRLKVFDLPLAPQGTPFQQKVWKALQAIPYGQTICYAELAQAVGKPGAARAVGAANRCNPLPIVIPCHRVIGKDGRLTGYRGGLELKQKLLQLEQSASDLVFGRLERLS